ncbi:MAG: methionyl-tRNA formyltransferase [Deltaproteobacteria bacterium]|nr:methionyl-tRNA formyltransferase [Deltaproteobacteria bacterium]
MKPRIVIATSRDWVPGLAERVAARCGAVTRHITAPEQLTAEALKAFAPDWVFFPHWSHRIPASVFDTFTCVIFHMTDVPFGRGGSPLQNLLVRGVQDTQMTALRCEAGLDTGPVYLKRPLSLAGRAEEIYIRGTHLIEDMIAEIVATRPTPMPQTGEAVAFARRRPHESEMAQVTSIDAAYDFIRMLDAPGYPAAFIETEFLRFEFSHASLQGESLTAQVRVVPKPKGS